MYIIPKFMALAYTAADEPTVLYVGESMAAAQAAVLAIHEDEDYARIAILALGASVVRHKHALPLVGMTLTEFGG